ncbi:MAG: peptidase, partial [Polyangiaceae bacterium]|nr:peptidase [Polyangiaceae bacterium]
MSDLANDPGVRMVNGEVGLEPFVKTLQKLGVSKRETYRILAAFKGFDAFKRPRKKDEFLIAIDGGTKKVKAFELKVSALDVYQAREDDRGLLVGVKLDMKIAQRLRVVAVRVAGEDLAKDLRRGRLRPSIVETIDSAFDGRASVGSMPRNSTLRVIVQEKTALGRFAQYDYVEAVEYVSGKPDTKPLRIYRFQDGHRFGYFDQNGREPYKGGWRSPVPGFPVTSGFNPKRFHPVLKQIRPHHGTDYGAPTGTPVHATSYGIVDFVG